MHVGIILDDERLQHEGCMINTLTRELRRRDHDVTQFLPYRDPDEPAPITPPVRQTDAIDCNIVDYPTHIPRRLRRHVVSAIHRTVDRQQPDVLYAIGEDTWTFAFDLAQELECPLAIDVWSAQLARKVPRGRTPEQLAACIAPNELIANVIRRRVDDELVSVVPMAVDIPATSRRVLDNLNEHDAISLAVLGSCTDLKAYKTLLHALPGILADWPQMQVFLELRGPHQHDVWRTVQKLGLLEQISCLTDASQFQTLLNECDIIALPERLGRVRSLTYGAMAAGIPILMSEDPFLTLTHLEDPVTIQCSNHAAAWSDALRSLLESPVHARHIGERGRAWVRQNHTFPHQTTALLAILDCANRGGAYSFPRIT